MTPHANAADQCHPTTFRAAPYIRRNRVHRPCVLLPRRRVSLFSSGRGGGVLISRYSDAVNYLTYVCGAGFGHQLDWLRRFAITPRAFAPTYSLRKPCITALALACNNTAVFSALSLPSAQGAAYAGDTTRIVSRSVLNPLGPPILTHTRALIAPIFIADARVLWIIFCPFLCSALGHPVNRLSLRVAHRHLAYYHLTSVRRAGGRG